jgi:serine/threonine-protein kinase
VAHDVFVSHSHHDKPEADAVCASLEATGIRCWIAPRDIVPGQEWGAAIVDAIRASRVMVLVFSAHANASSQVTREVERAVHTGTVVVPFRIEDVAPERSLEFFLGTPHWLDALTPPFEAHLKHLVAAVTSFLTVREPRDGPGSQTQLPFPALDPWGVAVDNAGAVYATDNENNRVLKLPAGASSPIELPFTGLQSPCGVAVDAAGAVYVADMGHDRVLRLPAGEGSAETLPVAAGKSPCGVAVDRAGSVYVVHTCDGGDQVSKLAAGASSATELPFPKLNLAFSVAVGSDGTVYVPEHGLSRVMMLTPGVEPTELALPREHWPSGIAVDSADNVYVSCPNTNLVLKLAPKATATEFPFKGLHWPLGVAAGSDGSVYVADRKNKRVVKLSAT